MTKSKLTTSLSTALLLCLGLGLSSCGTLSTIQLIVDTTETAIPVLEASGVPIPPQVPLYVAAVADCVGNQTGQLTPAQIAAVVACLTRQTVPTLTGLPPAVAAVITSIANAVAQFIIQNTDKPMPVITPAGQKKLDALRARAQVTAKKARASHPDSSHLAK